MATQVYPGDLYDDAWALLAPLILPAKPGGRPRSVNSRGVVTGLFYVLRAHMSAFLLHPGGVARVAKRGDERGEGFAWAPMAITTFLGHSSVAFTQSANGHFQAAALEDAREAMESLFATNPEKSPWM